MMISGSFAQAITVFYIFIPNDTFVLLHQFRKKTQKLPSAKLNGQRLNVMITLPERRLNDYETWNDYKEHVRTVDPEIGKDIDEVENISSIVSAMVEQRTSLGLSQRELAAMCGIPQSSVARIESCKTTPNLGTLLNIFSISVYSLQ